MEKAKIIVLKGWGVVFNNAYTDFMINKHSVAIEKYWRSHSDESGIKSQLLDYLTFTKIFGSDIDGKKLSDEQFYGFLSHATGDSEDSIKTLFRSVDYAVNGKNELYKQLQDIRRHSNRPKIYMVVNTDSGFLANFINREFAPQQSIASLFDGVLCSSDLNVSMPSVVFFEQMSQVAGVPFDNMLYFTNSEDERGCVQSFGVPVKLYGGTIIN